jgi:hypothetical protein
MLQLDITVALTIRLLFTVPGKAVGVMQANSSVAAKQWGIRLIISNLSFAAAKLGLPFEFQKIANDYIVNAGCFQ